MCNKWCVTYVLNLASESNRVMGKEVNSHEKMHSALPGFSVIAGVCCITGYFGITGISRITKFSGIDGFFRITEISVIIGISRINGYGPSRCVYSMGDLLVVR